MRWIAALALLVAGCATPAAETSLRVSAADSASVVEVVDGDTLVVTLDGVEESVRLIGINAPERDECGYAEASERLVELVARGEVSLVADVTDRDDFGRLLRYVLVEFDDVGGRLVAEGLVVARAYPPDTDRSDEYDAAEDAARSGGLGLWADDACGVADAAVRIVDLNANAPGDDAENPNGEWIELENVSGEVLDLGGWTVKDESSRHRFTFPVGTELLPGTPLRLRSGCGVNSPGQVHWCADGPVWTNSGDTAFLIDPSGAIVDRWSYP